MTTPQTVLNALNHVREYHPEVDRVTFTDDGDGYVSWLYTDSSGEAPPSFSDAIDVGLLEMALDAAEDAHTLPVTFEVERLEQEEFETAQRINRESDEMLQAYIK